MIKHPFIASSQGQQTVGKHNISSNNFVDHSKVICPTYAKNKTYHGFGENDPRLLVVSPDASNCDEINDLLEHCETLFSGTNTLLVLDDCVVSKDLKKRSNQFINLSFSGRHTGSVSLGINPTTNFYSETFL